MPKISGDIHPDQVTTLYFCGSGNKRTEFEKYTVPKMFRKTQNKHKMIFDGPGGAAIGKFDKIVAEVERGRPLKETAIPDATELEDKKRARAAGATQKKGEPDPMKGNSGAVTGKGTQSNIVLALQYLWERYHAGRKGGMALRVVNLVGFSRGAVTCTMLAHAIQESGLMRCDPTLRVNLFLFDPVAGSKNDFGVGKAGFDRSGRIGKPGELSSCVSDVFGIAQMHIMKAMWACWKKIPILPKDMTFQSTMPRPQGDRAGKDYTVLPMPGGHAAGARCDGGAAGQIGLHHCARFLSDHGVLGLDDMILENDTLAAHYAELRLNISGRGGKKKGPSFFRRKAAGAKSDYGKEKIWVNEDHRSVVEGRHRALVRKLDQGGRLPADDPDLRRLGLDQPETMEMLGALGFAEAEAVPA